MDTCGIVGTSTYCTPETCSLDAVCSNAPTTRATLKLFDTRCVGLGVFTTNDLDVGDVVGEYAGVLVEYEGLRKGQPQQAPKRNSRYTIIYNTPSGKSQYV
ncbi:hypothetical protein PC116_g19120 [Phytophthora cactorum]|nr:hypothetical protein PC119_g17304 [Phytophthora cactorum]KAG4232650.1 hypothetical protein PC116_g19120 [Phytophthora cactorum]